MIQGLAQNAQRLRFVRNRVVTLKEMEQEVFKYKKMVERSVEDNFDMMNELKTFHKKETKGMLEHGMMHYHVVPLKVLKIWLYLSLISIYLLIRTCCFIKNL